MLQPISPNDAGTPAPAILRPPGAPPAWERFAREHAAWLGRLPSLDEPLYALPRGMIRRLFGSTPMDHPAFQAELAFERLCRESRAVGFVAGRPIAYPHLSLKSRPSSRARRKPRPRPVSPGVNSRLKGYAGWLLTDPDFAADRAALEGLWRSLPGEARPRFPLVPASTSPDPGGILPSVPAPGPRGSPGFEIALANFCDRWELAGMATWHCPDPRGVLVRVPLHYRLTRDDDILHEIGRQQRALAAKLGIHRGAVGLQNTGAYARMLEILHWEGVARGRYGLPKPHPGFIGLVKLEIAAHLGLSIHQVGRLRKKISKRRIGKRAAVPAPWTRP